MLTHLSFDLLYSKKKHVLEQALNRVWKGNLKLIFIQNIKCYDCFEVGYLYMLHGYKYQFFLICYF